MEKLKLKIKQIFNYVLQYSRAYASHVVNFTIAIGLCYIKMGKKNVKKKMGPT